MLRFAVVLQARLSSRRLPGKVLMPLGGEPALRRMWRRVTAIPGIDSAVVATSDHATDDPLAAFCDAEGIPVARGPLDDVLARFEAAAPDCDAVVRLTGDCPLVDPTLVARHLERFAAERPWAEYVTNAVVRTMPDGLDVEVVDRGLLRAAHQAATEPYDREHVLPWVRRRARQVPITQEVDLSDLRWTLDTPRDHAVLDAVYGALGDGFTTADVYRLMLRRPDLIELASPAGVQDARRRIERHLESP